MTFAPKLSPLRRIPADIVCAADYERMAPQFLAEPVHAYLAGGSGQDRTVSFNRRIYDQWRLLPKLFASDTAAHTQLSLGRLAFEHPILLAPVAHQRLAHSRAELESARAAEATDSGMISSTLSSRTLEDIASVSGARRWFQLYFQDRKEDTLDLIRRSEAAGYQALVLTMDASIQQPSERAIRSGFQMPAECFAANLQAYPARRADAFASILQQRQQTAPSLSDVSWLREQSDLPLWVKGVMHPADAKALADLGIDGMVVSNHGGRTVDGVASSLSVLPAIRTELGREFPLLFDGGIRSGEDVFKALALGANAVLLGRLQVYALAIAGALGVAHMIKLIRQELELCMAVTGCHQLTDIQPACLHSSLPSGH